MGATGFTVERHAMRLHATALVLALALALPGAAAAQRADAPAGHIMISAFGGGAVFSDFGHGALVPAPYGRPGETVRRRIAASPSAAMAGAVAYWLSDGVAVRLGASLSPSRFEVRPVTLEEQPYGGAPVQYAHLAIWLYDADVLVRIPMHHRVVPYATFGLGAVTYAANPVPSAPIPAGAPAAFTRGAVTRGAGLLGAGVLVPIQDFALEFEVTDHLAPGIGGTGDAGVLSHLRALVGVSLFPAL